MGVQLINNKPMLELPTTYLTLEVGIFTNTSVSTSYEVDFITRSPTVKTYKILYADSPRFLHFSLVFATSVCMVA
ncbi:hypothetical protein NCCP28_26240 [Niallia sp. NCCP-28]|nr:hypothetical protein NCCP28_26240 [Niallia sp. NCCP-28]